jgi:hypothetical protein
LLLVIQTESLAVRTSYTVKFLLLLNPFSFVQWCLQLGTSNPKLMSRYRCRGNYTLCHKVLYAKLGLQGLHIS